MPSRRNFKVKYTTYDHNNRKEFSEIWKLVGKVKYTKSIKYNIESEITTKDQKTIYQYFHLSTQDSNFYIGAVRYLDPIQLDSYQKMVIKVLADSVNIPIRPKMGQMLPEATCSAKIMRGTGSVLMSMNVILINRKVDGTEIVETPAGKFKCFKISSEKISYSGMSIKKTKIMEWYAINVGLVRMEEYHKNGKLISYKVLESLVEDFFIP
ncbi:hypothetical protein DLK05_05960 [Ancylomarina longa]|uniref:DUF3108 domain-containing protein n=2 Tax=Ancylomarina longa TaxID=2487017 RepID=A0A434AWZ7_9BACT|nr:hypothetical protein DLK05_05960 [Ancylomarina longa]